MGVNVETKLIYQKMADVMRDSDAISKSRDNVAQRFKFRGIDDVYNTMHAILAKHSVFTVPEVLEEKTEERVTKSGSNLIYRVLKMRYTFYTVDGSSVSAVVIGEGMDSGDKAANKAMAIAHKYALLQVFAIPTEDEKDPDAVTPPASQPKVKADPTAATRTEKISEAQHRLLEAEIAKRDVDREALKKYYGLQHLNTLTKGTFEEVLTNVKKKNLKEAVNV